jgi:hypothetical protein
MMYQKKSLQDSQVATSNLINTNISRISAHTASLPRLPTKRVTIQKSQSISRLALDDTEDNIVAAGNAAVRRVKGYS